MFRKRTFALFIVLLVVLAFSGAPALAQGGDTSRITPTTLTFFTRYPVQEVALGDSMDFNLTLRTGDAPQVVHLEMKELPDGWTATFRGGGDIIRAAYVEPDDDTSIRLQLEPPTDVAPGDYRFVVVARGEGETVELPIELTIKDKLPPRLSLDTDLPTLRGTPSSTFRYDVKLKNEGDEELSVNLLADAPPGFLVTFKLSGKEVTSIPVAANETKRLSVEVKTFSELAADDYPITLFAQGGDVQASIDLTVEITGQPKLSITAPDGRLSGKAYAGDKTPLTLIVQNTGSAPARNVELSASAPNGWKVDFEPKTIPEIAAGKQMEVTANLQPAEQAVAGDYMVTLRARPQDGATESSEFRITVLTSTLWGVVGVGLIAVAVIVVGMAVVRFGRR
ncbi:MAG: hypothetical protein D6796_07795 [Caldilineae bacterium]|nr:MAG: hypothetical protein D6796_07795 [Caldilineae bacterium]